MKVKINTEINLAHLFDCVRDHREIYAIMEYLMPHASSESIVSAVVRYDLIDDLVEALSPEQKKDLLEKLRNAVEQKD